MLGKKSSQKSAKKRFLYSYEYRDQKRGEKARKNFSRNTRMMRKKNVAKKIVAKNCEKKVFYMHTNMVTKKWGGKTRETIFPETHR